MKKNGNDIHIEKHPLKPFLPSDARVLFLGSFPPPEKRWSMDFFYPNWNNDMWRIFGQVFYDDVNAFVQSGTKKFDKKLLMEFLEEKGIALYDVAVAVRRLKENASDAFLEIVEPADIPTILAVLPNCNYIVTTGGKAAETLSLVLGSSPPAVGKSLIVEIGDRKVYHYRMPSSSRAYPLKFCEKVKAYRTLFEIIGMI